MSNPATKCRNPWHYPGLLGCVLWVAVVWNNDCVLGFRDALRCTVVPALGNPCRERPPAVYGHFVNVPTHFNVKLPVISGHLPVTWTRTVIHWLSAPAITDNANKCRIFGGHFNQKLLVRTQTCDRQFSQISVLSSGDQWAISDRCHVIESDEPRDCGKSTPSLVSLLYDITSEK